MLSPAIFSDIKYSRWDTCINLVVTLCEGPLYLLVCLNIYTLSSSLIRQQRVMEQKCLWMTQKWVRAVWVGQNIYELFSQANKKKKSNKTFHAKSLRLIREQQ